MTNRGLNEYLQFIQVNVIVAATTAIVNASLSGVRTLGTVAKTICRSVCQSVCISVRKVYCGKMA